MRVLANSPAGGAARAGWPESSRSRRVPSVPGKRALWKLTGQQLRTSSVAAAGVAVAAVEVAGAARAAIDQARAGSRHKPRVRHDLSVATPHRDPPPPRGRAMCAGGTPLAGRISPVTVPRDRTFRPAGTEGRGRQQATRPIPTDGGDDVVGVEGAARDPTVRRLVAARRIAGRRPADTPGRPNSPE
jgi:hypothetical protein